MNNNPKISIIVPVYNTGKYLNKCIESLINQSYANIQVLLVDDGSTDDSGIICDTAAKGDRRISVIHKLNGGVSTARNAGLNKAEGDYIGFVDSDDYIEPGMYEKMLDAVLKYNADIAVCGKNEHNNGCFIRRKLFSDKEQVIDTEKALQLQLSKNEFDSGVCNKLFKRNCIEGLRFPVERKINEELVFVFDAISMVRRVVCINKALYNINIGNISSTRTSFSPKFFDTLTAYDEIIERCNTRSAMLKRYADVEKIAEGMSVIMRIALDDSRKYVYEAEKIRRNLISGFWKYIFYREMQGRHKLKYIALKISYKLYGCLMNLYYGKADWN